MLLTFDHIPTSNVNIVRKAFNRSQISPQTASKVDAIQALRVDFYQKINFIQTAKKKVQSEESLRKMKQYMYETYNLMSLLCESSSYSMSPQYKSILSPKTVQFEMNENGEVCSTAEIIFSRYSYVFSLFNTQQELYDELQIYTNNMEATLATVKNILTTLEDACVRMAKLYYIKDALWVGLESVSQKYRSIPELEYYMVECIYLLTEISFSNFVNMKILLEYPNSKKHNMLISSTVGFCLNKIPVVESLLEKNPTKINKKVKAFLAYTTTVQKFFRVLSLWNQNKIQEKNKEEKSKMYEQIYHENFILGRELKKFFEVSKKFPEIAFFENLIIQDVLKDIEKYRHLKDDIKPEFKKIIFTDLVFNPNQGKIPDIVRKMIFGAADLKMGV